KPGIRKRQWEPWASQMHDLAELPHVLCKLSGLLTEADLRHWDRDDLLPYAEHVVDAFGTERVMYGSDWPVMTLADRASEWYNLTLDLTGNWPDEDRKLFYSENARRFYQS